MSCYLCNSNKYSKRPGSVRDNSNIDILECGDCGLVYLSTLNHIGQNHYKNSGMRSDKPSDENIKKWLKETQTDSERRYQFVKEKITNKTILDFGCGVGGFLDMAKKSASKVSGVELDKGLQPSFKERGLNVLSDLDSAQGSKYDIITAFHVIEHLRNPKMILSQLSEILAEGGKMIIEVPNSDDVLLTLYENNSFQNFTYWSQHLFLFNKKTISELVKQSGLKLNLVKHIQRYPLSNHLYWMSKGKPGGHQTWGFLNNKQLNEGYESQLALIGKTDTIIVEISK